MSFMHMGYGNHCLNRWRKKLIILSFYQGIPDKEILEQFTRDYVNIILVRDDVMAQGMNNEDLMNLFTTYSHHMGITVLFLLQNIFPPGKCMRTVSLNAHYIIFFKKL